MAVTYPFLIVYAFGVVFSGNMRGMGGSLARQMSIAGLFVMALIAAIGVVAHWITGVSAVGISLGLWYLFCLVFMFSTKTNYKRSVGLK